MLIQLNDENFQEETKNGLKLIEFYTTWCGYCKKQKTELESMDKVWIGQIDAEESKSTAMQFNISSYPTFIILKNGKEVERFSGLRKKEDIMNLLMQHL